MRTSVTKVAQVERDWFVIDATDVVLGRLATEAARILRGKHKTIFSPYLDCGDHIIVINADKIRLTSQKAESKLYYRHSGYPGGLRATRASDVLATHPERVVEAAIRGMLPKNRLGRQMYRKLKVYAGPNHPHEAQLPKRLTVGVKAQGEKD
jgi:large subunit ribosomal protein L13